MKFLSIIVLAFAASTNVTAQSWPAKPVRVIVTFAPGGSSDIVARLVAIPLQAELGQSVIVDNKPGAGGTIGAAEAASAAPDGYTLLLSNSAPISISPAMQDEPRYDRSRRSPTSPTSARWRTCSWSTHRFRRRTWPS
jgi:tripartite-type tricarboxylate transporter receptor subunit TctC